ncbi:hypothetical protein OUZ56_006872 [Daphnia magna]|uniref:Uncharacterized protein n=1 Tax=Daphnia magna TaxID=35525 RepID=A0ABQ9YWX5_9CRUS|nr:hypothetical protein OUZ56_006872 [Daphnia magna]
MESLQSAVATAFEIINYVILEKKWQAPPFTPDRIENPATIDPSTFPHHSFKMCLWADYFGFFAIVISRQRSYMHSSPSIFEKVNVVHRLIRDVDSQKWRISRKEKKINTSMNNIFFTTLDSS